MKSMLSNPKYLVEDYRTEDLLNFSGYVEQLKTKVNTSPLKSSFGIVGDYGTGKSVMLETFRKDVKNDAHWVHFDAWKYPERNNLWEGFVLDFVRQVSPADFRQVLKEFDGTAGNSKKTLVKTFGLATGVAVNVVAPGAGVVANKAIDKLSHFADTSPARRIFQIQDILERLLIKRVKKPIYIVIEDADRSGDAGIYFIETLSQFLRNLEVKATIKVFIPIARKSFLSEKREAYIKALDYVEFFSIGSQNLTSFAEKVFAEDLLSNEMVKHHLVEWLQRLIVFYKLTIRDLKFILRNADAQHKALQNKGFTPDPRIVLIVESTKYIEEQVGGKFHRVYDRIIENRFQVPVGSQVGIMIFAVAHEISTEQIADVLNAPDDNANIFRRNPRFIENDLHAKHARNRGGKPIEFEGQYSMPLYYIL